MLNFACSSASPSRKHHRSIYLIFIFLTFWIRRVRRTQPDLKRADHGNKPAAISGLSQPSVSAGPERWRNADFSETSPENSAPLEKTKKQKEKSCDQNRRKWNFDTGFVKFSFLFAAFCMYNTDVRALSISQYWYQSNTIYHTYFYDLFCRMEQKVWGKTDPFMINQWD